MKKLILTALVLTLVAPALAEQGQSMPAAPTDARFEFLKGLAGTWTAEGEGPYGGTFEFRITAGGHAVEEREFAGSPKEMVTLYHMEGDRLVATHYCMLGNRPRLTGTLSGKQLTFACDGKPGNAASHDDEHVHAWSMKLADDGSLHYRATIVKAGEETQAPTMVLQRGPQTAAR